MEEGALGLSEAVLLLCNYSVSRPPHSGPSSHGGPPDVAGRAGSASSPCPCPAVCSCTLLITPPSSQLPFASPSEVTPSQPTEERLPHRCGHS